jgi:transcriptional regulator with XRE-family HTH domain
MSKEKKLNIQLEKGKNTEKVLSESDIKLRLQAFLKEKGLSQAKFETSTKLSNGFVNNVGKGISSSSLNKISKVYPDLNTTWLLTGDGIMLLDDTSNPNIVSDTNEKINTLEETEKQLSHYSDRSNYIEDTLNKLIEFVERIDSNLIGTRHGVEMNQALVKANLYQSAKLELIATKPGQWTKKDHQSIVRDLDALTAKIFEGIGV